MSFGKWMRSIRKRNGWSMSLVATRAGVSQPVWSEWENDIGERRPVTLHKIADGLEMNYDDVLDAFMEIVLCRAEVDDPSLQLANRVGNLLRQVPETIRPRVAQTIEQMAQVIVSNAA